MVLEMPRAFELSWMTPVKQVIIPGTHNTESDSDRLTAVASRKSRELLHGVAQANPRRHGAWEGFVAHLV